MTNIDWSGCPIVQTNPKKLSGVPTVRDYRVSADAVIENYDDGMTAVEICYQFSLPLDDVEGILGYVLSVRQGHVAHLSRS